MNIVQTYGSLVGRNVRGVNLCYRAAWEMLSYPPADPLDHVALELFCSLVTLVAPAAYLGALAEPAPEIIGKTIQRHNPCRTRQGS